MISVHKNLEELTLDELNIKTNELNQQLYGFSSRVEKVSEHYEKLEVLNHMKRLMLDEVREEFKLCENKDVEKLKAEAKKTLEKFNNMKCMTNKECEAYLKDLKRRELKRLMDKLHKLEEEEQKLKDLENQRMEELRQREEEYLESLNQPEVSEGDVVLE